MARSMSLSGMLTRCRLGRFPLCQGENLRSIMAIEAENLLLFFYFGVLLLLLRELFSRDPPSSLVCHTVQHRLQGKDWSSGDRNCTRGHGTAWRMVTPVWPKF